MAYLLSILASFVVRDSPLSPVSTPLCTTVKDVVLWLAGRDFSGAAAGLRVRISLVRGYGLVVERVLAKDETGVRFSLAAPFVLICASTRTRTWNDSSEDCSDIHFTIEALSVTIIRHMLVFSYAF